MPRAGCIFAANGVGCVLAELGNLTAAKEVFLQVCVRAADGSSFSAQFKPVLLVVTLS